MEKLEDVKKNLNTYWLGPVVGILEIGEYSFVAHTDLHSGELNYSIYINNVSIGRIARSLDEALVAAIAYKHDGPNSQAAGYFMKMITDSLPF